MLSDMKSSIYYITGYVATEEHLCVSTADEESRKEHTNSLQIYCLGENCNLHLMSFST